MGDRTQVNLRVDPERKEEWVNYVEGSPEVENLTQLIRLAVTRHINDDVQGDNPEVSVDTSDIEQSLTRLENKMDALSDDVGVVKDEATPSVSRSASKALPDQEEVFTVLPSGDGPEDGITPPEVAQRIYGVNVGEMEIAKVSYVLPALHYEMSAVRWEEETLRFWKEDD
jgi:hypothetical protein